MRTIDRRFADGVHLVDDPLAVLAGPQTHQTVLRLAKEYLPAGAKILDCPAGSGALARELHRAGFSVVPADLLPENFGFAELECVSLDMSKRFPFLDDSFHAIVSVEGIEHLEDQFTFVRQCSRVLRNGGYFLLTTPNILNLHARLKFLFTGFWPLFGPVNEGRRDATHDHIAPITYPLLRYILHTNGFLVRRVTTDAHRRSARCLSPLIPLVRAVTRATINHREMDVAQRQRNAEIMRSLFSRDILLGRTLVVVAEKRTPEATHRIHKRRTKSRT